MDGFAVELPGAWTGRSSGADIRFEQLLSKLSSEFLGIRPDQVDATITAGLFDLMKWAQVDRALLLHFQPHRQITVTHYASVPGFAHLPPHIVDDQLPWIASQVRQGKIVRLASPSDLPPEATKERAWSETYSVRAHLEIPCMGSAQPMYALAFSSGLPRIWPDELISRLKLVGEVFTSALARKVTETQLQEAREDLAHMVRVSTIGQLATSLAHEIKQPLCAVMTNAQAAVDLLALDNGDIGEVRAALADIIKDTRCAAEVIDRSHSMLKRQNVDFTPQDINHLARGAISMVGNYAMIRHVKVDSALSEVPRALGHGVQIQQVMTNLIVNAIDAIRAGATSPGRVLLSTHFDSGSRRVIVSVKDNGVGLPLGTASRIFEPFYTTKPKGLGMGLAIARTIAEAHSGELWFQANPDNGTTFNFALPALLEPVP